jgi:DNA invertase Pin-like site-specific DNA recombinase
LTVPTSLGDGTEPSVGPAVARRTGIDPPTAAAGRNGARVRPRALVYARCSTTEQDYSRQLSELRRDADRLGWSVVGDLGSYVSGAANDSDLNEIRSRAARREFDVLMLWELSRLSRRGPGAVLTILTGLERQGVRTWSHSETWLDQDGPARELLISVFAWWGAQERAAISARTKSGIASRKALGIHVGRPKGSKDKHPRRPRRREPFSRVVFAPPS